MSVAGRKFTVFEGPDFSGKSTLHKAFVKSFLDEGEEVVTLREPGGTELGERLRKLILAEYNETVHPETDILLHMAYRVQNVREIIVPALAEDKLVVSDRFLYSTWCLNVQRFLDTHPHLPDLFMSLMPAVTGGRIPEPLVFLIKTPKEIREARREAARAEGKLDRMEQLSPEIQDRIDASYVQMENGPSTIIVDGSLPLEEQVAFCRQAFAEFQQRLVEAKENEERRKADLLAVTEGKKTHAEVLAEQSETVDPQPVEESPEFDLEASLEAYAEKNIIDALFDEVPSDKLPEVIAEYRALAKEIVREIFKRTGEDQTIFHSSRVGQLNQHIHSVFHFGHKLKLWKERVAKQDPVDESIEG